MILRISTENGFDIALWKIPDKHANQVKRMMDSLTDMIMEDEK